MAASMTQAPSFTNTSLKSENELETELSRATRSSWRPQRQQQKQQKQQEQKQTRLQQQLPLLRRALFRLPPIIGASLVLSQAIAAAAGRVDSSFQILSERDLICASCTYIFEPMDEWVKEIEAAVPLPRRKARQWLKKTLAKDSICPSRRFSTGMGVEEQDGKQPRLVENALRHAKLSGLGEKGSHHMQRVAAGTHEDIRRDRKVGSHVEIACNYWRERVLDPLTDSLEGLLKSKRNFVDYICNVHLRVCDSHDEL